MKGPGEIAADAEIADAKFTGARQLVATGTFAARATYTFSPGYLSLPGSSAWGHSGVSQATELSEESMRTRDAATSALLVEGVCSSSDSRERFFERQPIDCAECQLCGGRRTSFSR